MTPTQAATLRRYARMLRDRADARLLDFFDRHAAMGELYSIADAEAISGADRLRQLADGVEVWAG